MTAHILPFPERGIDRAALIKALLRKLLQVTTERPQRPRKRRRTALHRADRAVRDEVRALERLIEAVSYGEAKAVRPAPARHLTGECGS